MGVLIMKYNKTCLICALFLVLICCIGAVSAADGDNATLTDNAMDEAGADVEPAGEISTSGETDEQTLGVGEDEPALGESEKIIYVGHHNTTEGGEGTYDNPYTTFKAARDSVNGEDSVTIYVFEGEYRLGEGMGSVITDPLTFNTNNLNIIGNGSVIIKNHYNEYGKNPEAFALASSSASFTFTNLIFDFSEHTVMSHVERAPEGWPPFIPFNEVKTYFMPFNGAANIGTFNNCSFINMDGDDYINYYVDYNSVFVNCSFDKDKNARIFYRIEGTTTHVFERCAFSTLTSSVDLVSNVNPNAKFTLKDIWFGQNSLPAALNPASTGSGSVSIPVVSYAKFDVTENYLGDNKFEIVGKLVWNGTDSQEGMDNFPFNIMTVKLETNTGIINSTVGLVNGTFRTTYISSSQDNELYAILNNQEVPLEFKTVNITADPVSIYYGEDQNITINFSPSINATVSITVNNNTYPLAVSDAASAIFTIPEILKEGNYVVDILLNDNNYYGSASTNFTVSKVSDYTFEMIPSSEVKVGETLNITITLPEDATGNVTVKVGNDTQVLTAEGTIVANFDNLNATDYPVTVSYGGDDKYEPNELNDWVTVEKGESGISIDSEIIADYGEIAIPVTTVNAKGVSVRVFSKSGLQLLNATFEGDVIELNLAGGEYNLEVTTIVDDNYNPNTATASLTVNKINSSISICMIDGLNVTGVLKDSEGNAIADAEVSCLVGEENVTAFTNENGEFTVTVTSNVVLSMIFEGNSNFTASNAVITIKNLAPTPKATKIDVPTTMTKTAVDYNAGEKGTMFYFYLLDADGKAVANKGVKIGIFDKIYTVKTDKNGRGGLQINIANANYYTYGISFLGDDDYKASFAVCSLQIVKKSVTITPAKTSYSFKTSAKTKTVTATLKSTNSYIPKGKQVTLTIAGKTFKTTVGDKGQISFNIGSITAKGTYKVAIKFAGTNTYAAANSKTITIKIA
jgi:hypothetical protein